AGFLAIKAVAREALAQHRPDGFLCPHVGLGDGRLVFLSAHGEVLLIQGADHLGRRLRGIEGGLQLTGWHGGRLFLRFGGSRRSIGTGRCSPPEAASVEQKSRLVLDAALGPGRMPGSSVYYNRGGALSNPGVWHNRARRLHARRRPMGNRLSKIYTRTGDDGTTGLGDGSRVPKDSARVEAYGTVDELNSVLGVLLAVAGLPDAVTAVLTEVQHELFDLGA